ncbi:MAG: hypothetical protein U0228_15920 [Myxococcaceae bacterium]
MNARSIVVTCVVFFTSACSMGTAGDPTPISTPPPDLGGEQPAMPVEGANAPKAEDGSTLPWPAAATMGDVTFVANRDSVVLVMPAVTGARDYRVFRVPAGVQVSAVGAGEQVNGTTIHCAGYRQHNDKFSGTRELMRVVEVTDVQGPTTLVVEAIDTACPYPGAMAPVHQDIQVTIDEVPPVDRIAFSIFTPDEVRARFGSLVLNGHGPGPSLGVQGPTAPPKVLARTAVKVTPAAKTSPRTADFFDDFDGTSGAITSRGDAPGFDRTYKVGRAFGNSKWDFFVYNDHNDMAQLSEERGVLHITLPDWEQDVFATVVAVPRKPAPLSDTAYLHLTFEVASDATSRRYWWVGVCGAGAAGQTFDAQNHFLGHLVQTSFFYEPDGLNTSTDNWNCLQFFPRDGSPFELGPLNKRSESDIRVMVNTAGAPMRKSVVNLSPAQYPDYAAAPSWFMTQDAQGNELEGILDGNLNIAPRTRFDAWIKRDRMVLYVNGNQRLCNDFPNHALTMNEAAVTFGQVLYHTAAERLEFSRDYDDRTGQRYYLEVSPYVDERDWDNMGFESNVGAPSDFDPSVCFKAP